MCVECDEVNDIEHMILKCAKYQAKRLNYPLLMSASSMIDLLKEVKVINHRTITQFCKDAGIDL